MTTVYYITRITMLGCFALGSMLMMKDSFMASFSFLMIGIISFSGSSIMKQVIKERQRRLE